MAQVEVESGGRVKHIRLIMAIAIVVAVVVISDYWYWSDTHQEVSSGPSATLTLSAVLNGHQFTLGSVSSLIEWNDTDIFVDDGTYVTGFGATTEGLTSSSPPVSQLSGPGSLGDDVHVWCNITDLQGNGLVDDGDYFTLTAGVHFWEGPSFLQKNYNVSVEFEPTSWVICEATFTG